jgi:hypothetical protein
MPSYIDHFEYCLLHTEEPLPDILEQLFEPTSVDMPTELGAVYNHLYDCLPKPSESDKTRIGNKMFLSSYLRM